MDLAELYFASRQMVRLGVTAQRVAALILVRANPGLNLHEVAMLVDHSKDSKGAYDRQGGLLRGMVDAGHIEDRRPPGDRRTPSRIYVGAAGLALLDEITGTL